MIDPFEIALAFETNEYTWRISDEDVVPTEEDITQVIDHAIKVLIDSERDRIELPHLIIQREGDDFDIFVQMGTKQLGE